MSSAMAHSSVVAVVSVAAPNMSWNHAKFNNCKHDCPPYMCKQWKKSKVDVYWTGYYTCANRESIQMRRNDDGTNDLRREREGEGVFLLQPEKHVKQVLVLMTRKGRCTLFLFGFLDDTADYVLDLIVAPPQIARGSAQPPCQP